MDVKGNVILSAKGMVKHFGITKAVRGIDCKVCEGDVMCIIGENGSGKSTLVNMFCGLHQPTSGEMELLGKAYTPKSLLEARNSGIGIIVQEVGTVGKLTVAENIFMGNEKLFSKRGIVNRQKMFEEADKVLASLGIEHIHGRDNINDLSFEDRKLVEVAMVMYFKPRILVLDESTTALSKTGRDVVYRLIDEMKSQGNAILFISHDLEEVIQVSNKVMVMRDGEYIDTLTDEDINVDRMRRLMIGRDLSEQYYRTDMDDSFGETVLEVRNITRKGMFEDVSFDLHAGEILGIGGLTESGIHEVMKATFGIIPVDSGSVKCVKTNTDIRKPADAVASKMGYMSKNREVESMMTSASIKDNITVTTFDKMKSGRLLSKKKEKQVVEDITNRLKVKMASIDSLCSSLSGGNKQKVVICKWLANDSQILLMDCPTRGIDIGVKEAIYNLMYDLKKQGISILMVSEELPELIGMSDRIIILKDGKVSNTFMRRDNIQEHDLIHYMI